jgi:integrase
MNTYSITFFLRREKYIYCRLKVNGITKDFPTKESIHNKEQWKGRYVVDDRNKKFAAEVNARLEALKLTLESTIRTNNHKVLTPSDVLRVLESKQVVYSNMPSTLLEAIAYHLDQGIKLGKLRPISRRAMDKSGLVSEFLMQQFGVKDIPLSAVNTDVAVNMRAYLNARYSPASISMVVTVLRASIQNVMDDFPLDQYPDSGLAFNAFANKKITKVSKKSTKKLQYIPPDRETVVWDALESWHGRQREYLMVSLFMWNSGMGYGDLSSPFDITSDMDGHKILHYVRHKSGVHGRVIVHEPLAKIIEVIRAHQFEGKYNNWLPVHNFIENGKMNTKKYFRGYNMFKHFCVKHLSALLECKVTPHTLRHSFAVKMVQKGYSMVAVKEMMAHASIQTTENNYAHTPDRRLINEKIEVLRKEAI